MIQQLTERLLAWRNPDGGWGYYPGKMSRIEPTSLSLLALCVAGASAPAIDVLSTWPRQDGLLLDPNTDAPNVAFNAQAALAYLALGDGAEAQVVCERLLEIEGRTAGQIETLRQDNSLAAWPWRDGTASWVEPTAWCLLAVKRTHGATPSAQAAERISVAERMLADRMCVGGGWNYGNSVVFGQALPAHLAVTAVALMALADRPELPATVTSLRYLSDRRLAERSGLTLSLCRICLGLYGQPADDVDNALAETWAATSFLDNVPSTALAIVALSGAGQALAPSHG